MCSNHEVLISMLSEVCIHFIVEGWQVVNEWQSWTFSARFVRNNVLTRPNSPHPSMGPFGRFIWTLFFPCQFVQLKCQVCWQLWKEVHWRLWRKQNCCFDKQHFHSKWNSEHIGHGCFFFQGPPNTCALHYARRRLSWTMMGIIFHTNYYDCIIVITVVLGCRY